MFGCVFFHKWGKWDQFQKLFDSRERITGNVTEIGEIWQVKKCSRCGMAKELKVSDGFLSSWSRNNG